jgi:Flp pilus assembly protein TadG
MGGGAAINAGRRRCDAAAVEFAIIATFLSLLVLGAIDFGMGYWEQIQVGNAARAGAEYAVLNGYNQSNIQNAVTSATALTSVAASPAPTQACGCPSATTGISAATCGAACTGGGTAGKYVTVNATPPIRRSSSIPGLAVR